MLPLVLCSTKILFYLTKTDLCIVSLTPGFRMNTLMLSNMSFYYSANNKIRQIIQKFKADIL